MLIGSPLMRWSMTAIASIGATRAAAPILAVRNAERPLRMILMSG
jgi:hypothetical protein